MRFSLAMPPTAAGSGWQSLFFTVPESLSLMDWNGLLRPVPVSEAKGIYPVGPPGCADLNCRIKRIAGIVGTPICFLVLFGFCDILYDCKFMTVIPAT